MRTKGAVLIAADMEKAFDRCSWSYLQGAIKKLRFGTGFQKWFDLLYNDQSPPKRKVYANGYLSDEYAVKIGTAQGCPLSPLLFLIITEGFIRLIQNNATIMEHIGRKIR